MMTQASKIKWGRIGVAALIVFLISFLIIFCIIFVYALALGFQARGAPDQAQIQHFANQVSPWAGRIGPILLTGAAAAWLAGRVDAPALHGILLGVVVALFNLVIRRPVSAAVLFTGLLVIGAGWLGGFLGNRRKLPE